MWAAAIVVASVLGIALCMSRRDLLYLAIPLATLLIVVPLELHHRTMELHRQASEKAAALHREASELIGGYVHRSYSQVEALFSLFQQIRLNAPLPPMGDWAVSPDFANVMIGLLRERKPKLVVELGSGVSTLIAGYIVKEWGGRVVSLEHQERFATLWAREVHRHGLNEVVMIFWAPLEEVTLQGQTYLWYRNPDLGQHGAIDLLMVDGPPGELQKMARYPALPLLQDRLSKDAVILLDDAAREDEKKIVELWQGELPDLTCEDVDVEKGATILRRIPGSASRL
jgi:predicted O-methyltransferase YrrM